MSSEAKVGLLVGLAFVFVISFLINGIPKISSYSNNNELTSNMIKPQANPDALAARERKAIKQVQSFESRPKQLKKARQIEQNIRFIMPLPKNSAVVNQPPALPTQIKPEQSMPQEKNETITENKSTINPQKFYVIQEGDNLTLIAKKFYGPDEGNKIKNIEKIFSANSGTLSSPDRLDVGRKIIIPDLDKNKTRTNNESNIFTAELFQNVKNTENIKQKKNPAYHIVRDGESLWQIAELHLSNGGRYKEIAALNAGLLDDEDNLSVGLKLKLPPR